uniref:hypothetical protein n=1 Tax=Stenotrophomonas maltophilia TaxID=40324 RepID=UPI003D03E728
MKVIRIVVSALALVPIACFAKGPIGIGKLEVGVSRSAVEGLSPTDGVYLAAPLEPYEYKGSPPFSRTLTRRPIKAMRSVHVEAK